MRQKRPFLALLKGLRSLSWSEHEGRALSRVRSRSLPQWDVQNPTGSGLHVDSRNQTRIE